MTDAYGRRCSSRSIPTGKGSRGGGSGLSPAYWRAWRAAHPEYRERERTRSIQKRLVLRIRAIIETGTDAGYSRLTTSVPVSLEKSSSERKTRRSVDK